jgi:DNA-binding NarL/FixJ family response regulator
VSTTVVIADDHALVRAGFRALVDSEPDLQVVGEASTGGEAVEVVMAAKPDVVLMDVRMPGMDGLEATRRILGSPHGPSARILMLTTFDLDEYVFEAIRAGASGFLLKDTPPSELLSAIRVIAGGDALLAPSVTRRLIAEFASRPTSPVVAQSDQLDSLTDRELEVLKAVANGKSNAEIAEELHMSVATVKTHVSRVLTKLDARDRTQLVVIAFQSGVVTPS